VGLAGLDRVRMCPITGQGIFVDISLASVELNGLVVG